MNTLEAIYNRRSIRKYLQTPLKVEEINEIVKAGMAGPSAANYRPWHLLVVTDKKIIQELAKTNRYSKLLDGAMMIVVVVADLDLAIPSCPEYWVVDGSIAAQNMILAATELNIGSCWVGQYPQKEKMEATAKFFDLPETKLVHSIITFGYPDEERKPNDYNEPEKVHFNKW